MWCCNQELDIAAIQGKFSYKYCLYDEKYCKYENVEIAIDDIIDPNFIMPELSAATTLCIT